ncbi:MAG TPA: ABC transporter ATP-binding protein [Oscillospiraceae bacterium]|jgi:ABC-2 type transport system ATP-binding protein|nr:ABC transporter ATP-binding protein [Oscillospiraceae bacterium]
MLKADKITKVLKGNEVLSNISYTFENGKIYLLTGHNGCGKTMLLRALCGLITPDSGEIICDKKCNFGVVIETPKFMENETGYFNLCYLASIRNIINKDTIKENIKLFDLDNVKNKKVKTYSLGMKQRLGLCQAVMEDPDIILLDEPFNAIDEENLNRIYEILNGFRDKNKIIIIASHGIVDRNKLMIDETIVMDKGKILKEN